MMPSRIGLFIFFTLSCGTVYAQEGGRLIGLSSRPVFELWLVPHVVLAAMPPLLALFTRRERRCFWWGTVLSWIVLIVIAALSWDVWAATRATPGLVVRYWIDKCVWTGLAVLTLSATLTFLGVRRAKRNALGAMPTHRVG